MVFALPKTSDIISFKHQPFVAYLLLSIGLFYPTRAGPTLPTRIGPLLPTLVGPLFPTLTLLYLIVDLILRLRQIRSILSPYMR